MFNRTVLFYGILLVIIILIVSTIQSPQKDNWAYSKFIQILENPDASSVTLLTAKVSQNKVEGDYIDRTAEEGQPPKQYTCEIIASIQGESLDAKLLAYNETNPNFEIKANPESGWMFGLMTSLLPILLLIGVWFFILRQMQMGGSKAMSFGKSRARLNSDGNNKVTFADVAGCDEAKDDLQEIVEYLKDSHRFQKLGGKIPRGVLLHGPPGTGKTLLARAVAGEANVPFFSISGSDFVEMFVGVGASRVRDLFEQGKKHSPCIIFMDEIDAVGRQRFAGVGGGHDEREQTLNQLLVEMDGFNSNDEVILIAATNRPDVLDPALLRPGRFDRQIIIDLPDLSGREGILKVHSQNVVISKDVDMSIIARRTPGFSGADLHNTINEAALMAARKSKDSVGMEDLEEAIERVTAGPERKSRMISDKEKKTVAYHEAGHALVGLEIVEIDPIHKVSILPRGRALGYTMHLPLEERFLTSKRELMAKMATLLGGRVAEEIIFGDITTGAQNDLERVTTIAHKMVCNFGMSDKLGPLTFGANETQVFLGRDFYKDREYSEEIAFEIDKEVRQLVDECYHRCKKILEINHDCLDALANALLEREVLAADEVKDLLKDTKAARNGSNAEKPSADEAEPSPPDETPVATEPRITESEPQQEPNNPAEQDR
ncbi:MAG: ATP-dependent zinc metalloprotease FtsH [Candidatus Hinthialibacter antarcticus]|nr:ATP-dependent zinc metalloprotease FtsH [Candidatus Hinthialibacter antarcticus]